jgi:hypothetical protein
MPTTFQENGATYTVRALTLAESQQAINIAVDLLWFLAQKYKWQVKPEDKGRIASYPYAVRTEAVDYASLYMATVIEGETGHAMPQSVLEAIDPAVFEQWSKDIHHCDSLRTQWLAAYDQANKAETDPQAPSAEVPPASD